MTSIILVTEDHRTHLIILYFGAEDFCGIRCVGVYIYHCRFRYWVDFVVSTYQKVARIGKLKRESKGFMTAVFAILGGFFCSAVSLNPRRVVLGGHGY